MGAAATPVVSEAECTRAFEELEWDVSAKRSASGRSVSLKFKAADVDDYHGPSRTQYTVPSAANFTLQLARSRQQAGAAD